MEYNLPLILGRAENKELVDQVERETNPFYDGKTILITGSEGSLGSALQKVLRKFNANVVTIDITGNPDILADVTTDEINVPLTSYPDFDIVYHLAANKHAPEGEVYPIEVVNQNINGVVKLMSRYENAHHILSSTCKSADPETVYGATKLIAERIVLDAGGSVARFYNVPETSGNVFEIWDRDYPNLKVAACKRFFISKKEAIGLLLAVGELPSGRYTVSGVVSRGMLDIAASIYPDAKIEVINPRRGDRSVEPVAAKSENVSAFFGGVAVITSVHDKDYYDRAI